MFVNSKLKCNRMNAIQGNSKNGPAANYAKSAAPVPFARSILDSDGFWAQRLLLAACDFENIGAPMGTSAVLFPAANPAEGAAVTPGVIVSGQIIVIRQSQHGGTVVHVQGAHGVGERLILILVGQGEAVRVVHLKNGRTAAGHGGFRGKEHGDLRPALEDIDHQIVALDMAVERGEEVTAPASIQVRDADQSQFAHQAVAPEVAIKQSVESAVEPQGGGSIQPPR